MAIPPRHQSEGHARDEFGLEAAPAAANRQLDSAAEQQAVQAPAEETLDDVQSYLHELFGRYGLSQTKVGEPSSVAAKAQAPPSSAESLADLREETDTPEPPIPLRLPVPKPPPECRRDILTLRELSTRSARGAIAHFDAGRLWTATWARFWLCMAALGLTLFFLRAVEPLRVRTLGAAAVAFTLAVYWCGQFWLLTYRAGRLAKSPTREPGAHD